ncbi:unnamed protein product [Cutaneotrichosporon oleaginosum]
MNQPALTTIAVNHQGCNFTAHHQMGSYAGAQHILQMTPLTHLYSHPDQPHAHAHTSTLATPLPPPPPPLSHGDGSVLHFEEKK